MKWERPDLQFVGLDDAVVINGGGSEDAAPASRVNSSCRQGTSSIAAMKRATLTGVKD